MSAAREHRLPTEYIENIESVKAIEDPDCSRVQEKLGIYKTTLLWNEDGL